MRRLLSACFVATVLTSSAAWAGPITLSSTFSNGQGSAAGFQSCGSSQTNGILTESCTGRLVNTPIGMASIGLGLASITTTGGLAFHASSDLSLWVDNSTNLAGTMSTPYVASLISSALLQDTVAVQNTGSASAGFLQFSFAVTGSVSKLTDTNTLDGFVPFSTSPILGQGTGSANLVINGVSASFNGPRTALLTVPFTFGSGQSLSLTFNALASGAVFATYQGERILTDFSNTAVLFDTTILDANQNVISGATLTSQNGLLYDVDLQAVPEPASGVLLALGAVAFIAQRRWRLQKSRRTRRVDTKFRMESA